MCLRHGAFIKEHMWTIAHSKYEENAKISNPSANTAKASQTHGDKEACVELHQETLKEEKKENWKIHTQK